MSNPRKLLVMVLAALGAACGGTPVAPTYVRDAAFARPAPGPSCAAQTCIYVTNNAGPAKHPLDEKVIVFPRDANGNVPPVVKISGPKTQLVYPRAVTLDAGRNLYVSNYTPLQKTSNVAVFAPGANGNIVPSRVLAGAATQLHSPSALTLDASQNLYVVDQYDAASGCGTPTLGCWAINVYAPGAKGNVAPIRSIRGPATKLFYAYGDAADAAGNVYVADGYFTTCCVTVYAAGANGNVKPVRTIGGTNTGLDIPIGIALDSNNNIYVLNAEGSPTRSVTVYAAGANGNVAPIRMIVGQNTGLYAAPVGIAVDHTGRLYVLQSGTTNSIEVFAPGANGNVAPVRVISGAKTGMNNPWSIAVQ